MDNNELDNYKSVIEEIAKRRDMVKEVKENDKVNEESKISKSIEENNQKEEEIKIAKEIEIGQFYEDIKEDDKREDEKNKIDNEREEYKKRKRSLKGKKKTMANFIKNDSIIFIIYLIMLLIVLFFQINVDTNYKINTAINKYFNITDYEIESIPVFLSGFMDHVFKSGFKIYDYYKLISKVRINQRRLKEVDDLDPLISNFSDKVKAIDSIDPNSEFNSNYENSDLFKTNYNQFLFNKDLSFLELGGYQIIYDPIDYLDKDFSSYYESKKIEIVEFCDILTSSITIDFTILNLEINYICPIVFILTKSRSGFTKLNVKIFYIDSSLYKDNYAEIIFEAAICLIFLIYIIFTIFHLKYRIDLECLIRKEEEKLKKIHTINYKKNVHILQNNEREYTFLDKFYVLIEIVFYDLSIFTQIGSFILSVICLSLWLRYSLMVVENTSSINQFINNGPLKITLDNKIQDNLLRSGSAFNNYLTCICLNVLFIFFKLFKIIVDYFPRTKIFLNALRDASDDLISFGIFYFISFIGVSIFAFLFYGKNVNEYRTYGNSLLKTINDCFTFFDESVLIKMYDYSQYVTFLYCISIIIAIRLILMKILLSIILYHYKIALEKYEDNIKPLTDYTSLTQKKILKIFPEHFIKSLLTAFISSIHVFFDIITFKICFKNSVKKDLKILNKVSREEGIIVVGLENSGSIKKNLSKSINTLDISKFADKSKFNQDKSSIMIPSNRSINPLIDKKEEEEIKLSLIDNEENGEKNEVFGVVEYIKIKDLSEFNLDFVDTLEEGLKDKYFESEKDKSKLSEYYEQKYRKSFKQLLIYMFYISTVIFAYVLTSFSPWHYILLNSVSNLIHSTPSNKLTNLNKVLKYDDIGDIISAKEYVFSNLKNMFEKNIKDNHYYYRANRLLNNSMLLTIRIQIPDNRTYQRKYDYLDIQDMTMKNEFRNNIALNSTIIEGFKFSYINSYREYGGFSFLMEEHIMENISLFLPSEMLLLSTFFTVEFFMENLEYQIITHTELTFTNNFGGLLEKTFRTHFTQLNIFQDIYDFILVVIELIFIINLSLHIFYFSKNLYDDIMMYIKWYREQIGKFSLKTILFRQRVRPEFLRFLEYLFDFERIIDLFISILSIYLIICKIFLYQNQYIFTMNYEYYKLNFYDLSNIMSKIDELYDKYVLIGAFLIVFLSLKIFNNIDVSEYFSILTKTIKNSAINYINFIVLVILIHPPFIFFSYYAFGYSIEGYNSIFKSILTHFIGFFSLLDYTEINEINIYLGMIYFFLYTLLINMLLWNFFVSIISKAQAYVKENLKNGNQKYSFKRVFCFCFMRKRNIDVSNMNSVNNEFDYSKKIEIIENQIDFSHQNEIEEFCIVELNYLKYVNEIFNSLKIKQMQIHLSYITKKGDGQNLNDNLYCDVDKSHIDCFSYFLINTYSKIINKLEDDIEMIQFYQDHLDNFNKFHEFLKKKVELQLVNDSYLENILDLEAQFISLFSDIEKLQNINLNYEEIINMKKNNNQFVISEQKDKDKSYLSGESEEIFSEDNDNQIDINKPY